MKFLIFPTLFLVLITGTSFGMGIKIPPDKSPSCDRGPGSRPFSYLPAGIKIRTCPLIT
jgi:hypothetical protein